ncbi:MAG: hypothetical protein E6507_09735 [Prevotella bivia]|nr:hypothetical protein [Prevotella bivia]
MLWSMVKVSYRQDNPCHMFRALVVAIGMVFHATELTAIVRTLKNGSSNLFPVTRVA